MNDKLLNSGLLGNAGKSKGGRGLNDGSFIFNGWNLDNGTTRRVINSNHDDLGLVAFETYNYARADGGNALGKYYRKKTITITLSICANDKIGLENLIDELKFQTSKTQGYLDIISGGIVRRWTATLTSLQFGRQSYNVNRIGDVALTFECINPLSFSLQNITKTYNGITGDLVEEIYYDGKVVAYPTIYVMIASCSDLTDFSIEMNGYTLSVSHTFNAGDFLVIDGESKLATINGTPVIYDGPFPALEPLMNHIEMKINAGATVSYDSTFIYKNLFL